MWFEPALIRSTWPKSRQGFTLVELIVLIAIFVLLLIILILLIWSLSTDSDGSGIDIAEVEVIPRTATVLEASYFQVKARLRDSEGNLIPECSCYETEWSLDQADVLILRPDPSPQSATLEAARQLTIQEQTVVVTATVAGVSGSAEILVMKAPTAGDRVLTIHDSGMLLDAALVTGRPAAAPPGCSDEQYDAPYAFAGVAPLGYLVEEASCLKDGDAAATEDGNVAVFSARRKVHYTGRKTTFGWTTGDDIVDARKPPDSILVGVTAWVSTAIGTEQYASELVRRDVDLANDIFGKNRVGIRVRITQGPTRIFLAHVVGVPCKRQDLEDQWIGPPPPPNLDDPALIHVIYLRDTDDGAVASGVWCPPDPSSVPPRRSAVIIMYMMNYMPTSLVHELGHAFSLGHTKDGFGTIDGFEPNNVMWKATPEVAVLRNHFSLGQAFRMSIDIDSWINQALDPFSATPGQVLRSGETEDCDPDPYSVTFCPKLYQDIPIPNL